MVMRFPGKTNAYLPYSALRTVYDQTNPNRIALRQARLSAWDAAMSANDTVRLQYAAKNRTLANAYKKWKRENSSACGGTKRFPGCNGRSGTSVNGRQETSTFQHPTGSASMN